VGHTEIKTMDKNTRENAEKTQKVHHREKPKENPQGGNQRGHTEGDTNRRKQTGTTRWETKEMTIRGKTRGGPTGCLTRGSNKNGVQTKGEHREAETTWDQITREN